MKKQLARVALISIFLCVVVVLNMGISTARELAQATENPSFWKRLETIRFPSNKKTSMLQSKPVIVHGLGFIEGHYVTNSLDALEENYKRGFRVFEVDLNMTSDSRLVARHDWLPEHYRFLGQDYPAVAGPIPFPTFKTIAIHGEYEPASWEELVALLKKYPDLYYVTDTKEADEQKVREAFSYLVRATKEVDPRLLDRIIPQIYNKEMLTYVREEHHFPEIIYTLYHHKGALMPEELASWSAAQHITAIAAFPFRLTPELLQALQKENIVVYAHTINKPEEAAMYKKKGVGIYSDYLFDNGKEFIGPRGESTKKPSS